MAGSVYAVIKPEDAFALGSYRNINLGTTGQVVKAGPGHVYGWHLSNTGAAVVFVKVYNKATAPTGSDTPALTIPVPAGGIAQLAVPQGIAFAAGIALRASTAVADNDTSAPAANQVVANVWYS